jgi:hypothetical protein
MYDCFWRLFLAAFPSDLGHVFAIATDLFSAFPADLSHMFAIAAHSHAALSGRFGPAAFATIAAFVTALRWHRFLHLFS